VVGPFLGRLEGSISDFKEKREFRGLTGSAEARAMAGGGRCPIRG